MELRARGGDGADEQLHGAIDAVGGGVAKASFGCDSESGCRFVDRILTVVQTRRLQRRPVLQYLYDAVTAHRDGQSPPTLA